MNLGAAIVAAALFKSQLKALVNGDDVIIGPPEPEPRCPPGKVWDGKQCIPEQFGL
mgnify:CR=1 FL=1